MFIDEAEISVRSGKGGDGFVHFHREKYVARGGPDGGDGGRGGDVILVVKPSLNTLSSFRHVKKYAAKEGGKGGINNMTGRSAEALLIPVPPGTVVTDNTSGEVLGDLVRAGQELLVCKGGRGGRGNARFVSSRNQAPRIAEKGEPAQERLLNLELKLIADVGIIGLPNAGKSSLLAALTNAQPKIADYPFTTLEPNLGVAELDMDTSLVLADIPGIIEGAHRGVGLGDTFLRHIQRTKVLIHVLDGLSSDPLGDFSQINAEMALFDENLIRKPQIVVLNKIDLPEAAKKWKTLEKMLEKQGYEGMTISALTRQNLQQLLWKVCNTLQEIPEIEEEKTLPVYRSKDAPGMFSIVRVSDGWMVRGAGIERAAAMTYWEFEGSLRRFQRLMNKLGIEEALRDAGIKNGDTVYIGEDHELEWMD
ncbi:MAG: GTPase ObgE [Anaerolineaceae bacterium]|nr:GTPase ObgE [Anaerolineaceae bacterium]